MLATCMHGNHGYGKMIMIKLEQPVRTLERTLERVMTLMRLITAPSVSYRPLVKS